MYGSLGEDMEKWLRWDVMVKDLLKRRGVIKDSPFPETIDEEQVAKGNVGSFLMFGLAKASQAYLAKKDYDKAIYYLEWLEEEYIRQGVLETGGNKLLPKARRKHLQQLKSKGREDELHPFIYINEKLIFNRNCFTKNGKPFVSVASFLNTLNIPSEWIREGKILKVSNDKDICYIANLKGKWRAYKGKKKKDIEAYLKEKEIYLPLKELCELLGLKLEWDGETYIGRVSKR